MGASIDDRYVCYYLPLRYSSDFLSFLVYAWARLAPGLTFNCYISPNILLADFVDHLYDLERAIRAVALPDEKIVISSNFNVKSPAWSGSPIDDSRDDLLLNFINSLNLVVTILSSTLTFLCVCGTSFIDVTIIFILLFIYIAISSFIGRSRF